MAGMALFLSTVGFSLIIFALILLLQYYAIKQNSTPTKATIIRTIEHHYSKPGVKPSHHHVFEFIANGKLHEVEVEYRKPKHKDGTVMEIMYNNENTRRIFTTDDKKLQLGVALILGLVGVPLLIIGFLI